MTGEGETPFEAQATEMALDSVSAQSSQANCSNIQTLDLEASEFIHDFCLKTKEFLSKLEIVLEQSIGSNDNARISVRGRDL